MLNFQMLATAKKSKEKFMANHPGIQPFLDEVNAKGFYEGQEIAIAVRYPDGTEYKTDVKVTDEDLDMINMLKGLMG
ncbi:MAG: hypothetical protein PHS19_01185 [Eubacteriales bacterium]|nr:hypothetical protein [Eubacteriales bacterium]